MKEDWKRYSCQIALPGFDEQSQQKLIDAKVLIIGMGGLGCPVAQYLVAAGVGTITIADYDEVSVTNLHRQILFGADDVGKFKAVVACEKLRKQNANVNLIALNEKIVSSNVMNVIGDHDVIVDCTDTIETKYLINDACVLGNKPLVYGAIYQFDGQVAVFNVEKPDKSRSANYRHLFPDINSAVLPNCASGGVLPTLAGTIGCMQASEVIKFITGCGEVLSDKLFIFDARNNSSRTIKINSPEKIIIQSLPNEIEKQSISQTDLMDLIETGSVYLIDVREEYERDEFNIGGEHVLYQNISALKLDTSKYIVIYCQSGRRSEIASKILSEKYPQLKIYSLAGGLNEWTIKSPSASMSDFTPLTSDL
jgi:molybdopterin/thiamine biosynthesis adenylyltransferase/rhodanese-related sulfurtransferase